MQTEVERRIRNSEFRAVREKARERSLEDIGTLIERDAEWVDIKAEIERHAVSFKDIYGPSRS